MATHNHEHFFLKTPVNLKIILGNDPSLLPLTARLSLNACLCCRDSRARWERVKKKLLLGWGSKIEQWNRLSRHKHRESCMQSIVSTVSEEILFQELAMLLCFLHLTLPHLPPFLMIPYFGKAWWSYTNRYTHTWVWFNVFENSCYFCLWPAVFIWYMWYTSFLTRKESWS